MTTTYILHITIVIITYECYHIHITHNHCYNIHDECTTYILHVTIVYYNIMNATTCILHITIVYYNMVM